MQSAEWIGAARVLRRSGFGTTGAEVDGTVAKGELSDVVASMLDAPFDEDLGALSTPIPAFDSALPPPDRTENENARFLRKRDQQTKELRSWWVRRMVSAERPVREKLTFLWHNHFATSDTGVRSAQLMAQQNSTIRSHCLGDFRSLAYAMLTDGAMLRWLNGSSNTERSPNENLAREFMELFALGHGNGYTEDDIREAARALTGWVVTNDDRVYFDPQRHDGDPKRIFGSAPENHDAASLCDLVLQHPNSANFIAGRLWRQLASDSRPPTATLGRLTAAYGTDRNLKSLTAAVLNDSNFGASQTRLINGPVDWAIGLYRTLKAPVDDHKAGLELADTLRALGQDPFYPPSVGGWPGGQAWLSTTAAGLRIAAASIAVKRGDISAVNDVAASERVDAAGYLLGIGKWSDRSARTLSKHVREPGTLVVAAANTPEYLTT